MNLMIILLIALAICIVYIFYLSRIVASMNKLVDESLNILREAARKLEHCAMIIKELNDTIDRLELELEEFKEV